MFLKPHRREKNGVVYEYWTLEESVRTASGPRHRTVAMLGKLPGLNDEARIGWEHIAEILDGRLHQLNLLREEAAPPQWAPSECVGDTGGAVAQVWRSLPRSGAVASAQAGCLVR